MASMKAENGMRQRTEEERYPAGGEAGSRQQIGRQSKLHLVTHRWSSRPQWEAWSPLGATRYLGWTIDGTKTDVSHRMSPGRPTTREQKCSGSFEVAASSSPGRPVASMCSVHCKEKRRCFCNHASEAYWDPHAWQRLPRHTLDARFL